MAIDAKGNSHKAAGRPDGGQFDRKTGQGSDDDLDLGAVDAHRQVFDRIVASMGGVQNLVDVRSPDEYAGRLLARVT